MRCGKQHEAFETFMNSLGNISTIERAVESQVLLDRDQHRVLAFLPSRKHRQFYLFKKDEVLRRDRFHSKDFNDSNSGFIYNQPFCFSPLVLDKYVFGETGPHFIRLFRAVVTFNCALSFHQRSINVDHSLRKTAESHAAHLYREAVQLLRGCYATLDASRVLAATLNNAAIISYESQDFFGFSILQKELYQVLIDMESAYPRSVDWRCTMSLYFNATLLTVPRTAVAA